MSLVLTGLQDYTEQNGSDLITAAVFGSKTISLLSKMVGIKSAETINIMDTDAVFQNGDDCGFSPSGTTALTQRTVTVGNIKVHEALCPKKLEKKYIQVKMEAGSNPEKIPFEKVYTDLKVAKIVSQLENAIWKGDTTSGDSTLARFDGIFKMAGYVSSATGMVNVNAITGTGTVSTAVGTAVVTGVGTAFVAQGILPGDKLRINGTVGTVLTVDSATQITLTANFGVLNATKAFTIIPLTSKNFATPYTTIDASNVIAIMQSVANAIPSKVVTDATMKIFVGIDIFRLWTTALTNANLFHYTGEASNFELVVPGTNVKVIGVDGLTGTNRIFAFRTSRAFYGTDLLDEESKFEMMWAKEAQEVRFMAEWKSGFNFAFLDEVTQFTLA